MAGLSKVVNKLTLNSNCCNKKRVWRHLNRMVVGVGGGGRKGMNLRILQKFDDFLNKNHASCRHGPYQAKNCLRACHYENTPFQIYRKFNLHKLKFFTYKNSDIFHISAQNIDCGYSLEPPRRDGSNEYHTLPWRF